MSYLQLSLLAIVVTGIPVKVAAHWCWWRLYSWSIGVFVIAAGLLDLALINAYVPMHTLGTLGYGALALSPLPVILVALGIALRVLTTSSQRWHLELKIRELGHYPVWSCR